MSYGDSFSDTWFGRKIEALRSSVVGDKWYFIKAAIVMTGLTLVGTFATLLPAISIPFLVVLFAAFSTAGAMYGVVFRRLHRQYKLEEGGKLSRWNRRWGFQLFGCFVLALFSAYMFIVESPRWDAFEWLAAWLSIAAYYLVFRVLRHWLGREYKAEYSKANAMRASLFVVAAVLCLLYVVASLTFGVEHYTSFGDAVDNTYRPFENASSALLSEMGKVSAFGNALTAFGMHQISAAPFVVVVAVRFVVYFSVFTGIVSLLGFCLLDYGEVKSELQLLPVDGVFRKSESVRKPYIALIVALVLASLVGFFLLENHFAQVRAVDGHTAIDAFIDEQTENIAFLEDGGIGKAKEFDARLDAASQAVRDCADRREEELTPLVNAYYDDCLENVDAYLDWHTGIFGRAASLLNSVGFPLPWNGIVRDEFRNHIRSKVDASVVEEGFEKYEEELHALRVEVAAIPLSLAQNDVLDIEWFTERYAEGAADAPFDLWACLAGEEGAEKAGSMLLSIDVNDRGALREAAIALIEEARANALAAVSAEG